MAGPRRRVALNSQRHCVGNSCSCALDRITDFGQIYLPSSLSKFISSILSDFDVSYRNSSNVECGSRLGTHFREAGGSHYLCNLRLAAGRRWGFETQLDISCAGPLQLAATSHVDSTEWGPVVFVASIISPLSSIFGVFSHRVHFFRERSLLLLEICIGLLISSFIVKDKSFWVQ